MQRIAVTIKNRVGLHARPAAIFVKEASRCASHVRLRNKTTGSDWANGKSLLSVLSLGIQQGHEVEVALEGPDEASAVRTIQQLLASGLLEV